MAADDEGAGGRPAGSASSSGSSGSSGSVFRRKIGGVPMWLIMLALLGVALGVSVWRKNKASASTSATTSTGTTAGTQTAQQTPPFIIQNYTSGGQGPAGPAGATGAAGAPGAAGGGSGLPITGGHPPVGPVVISVPPAAPPATPPTPPPAPAPPAAKASAAKYTVLPGDNLSSIAGKFGVPGGRSTGWQILWAFNTNLGNRQAAGVPPVRGSNPNLIYPGEVILIPS